jgi:hypothetical protein
MQQIRTTVARVYRIAQKRSWKEHATTLFQVAGGTDAT